MNISFLTSNKHKVDLANHALRKFNINVIGHPVSFNEIQSLRVEDVVISKAQQALGLLDTPFIVEDSGFYVKSLNGFPGAYVKNVFPLLGTEKFLKLLETSENREASFVSALAYSEPKTKEIKTFVGTVAGQVSKQPKGKNMRGALLNNIFMFSNSSKTLAELSDDEWEKFLSNIEKDDTYSQLGTWLKTHC